MLRLSVIIVLASTLGCLDPEHNLPPEEKPEIGVVETATMSSSESIFRRDEAWVCHHPGTKMHNKECIEDTYPRGCYVQGDNAVFCWLLMRPECENPEAYPAVQNVCYILK